VKWQNSKYGWLLGHVGVLEPGRAHIAVKGADFECLPVSFAGYVYAAANERGYKASCAMFSGAVVYAFYRPNDLMRPNLAAYPIVKKMRRET
jgi:hypothetical protein